ncbi:MAG: DinB family protein [Bacteroidetes bacterium]|nr:DinB family protein [Bacteroidota bacterium]
MEKETLIAQFRNNHLEFISMINTLSPEQQAYSYNGKWTALQQLKHLVLVLTPIDFVLADKIKLKERFGIIERKGMNYDELISFYQQGLEKGGKAPDRFVPALELAESPEQLSQSLAKLVEHIGEQLVGYTTEELNTYALPHPFLGNLSLQEFFYLMIFHPVHHAKQVKEHLQFA